jgi:hypothetical protein
MGPANADSDGGMILDVSAHRDGNEMDPWTLIRISVPYDRGHVHVIRFAITEAGV